MVLSVLVLVLVVHMVLAQEPSGPDCYSAGSIAWAVVGTLIVALFLAGAACLLWRIYWRSRRGKHLVLVTDPEGAGDQYAFDNPCFKDGSPIARTLEKEPAKLDHKARWSPWGALAGPRSADKRRALDDSFLGEPQVNVVALRSHDFTGLGFNICGNMRDGIFVKDVLHRGPASESGRIAPGDRIDSIRISFRHMVFEDALTILSYASPYDVQLEVENASNSRPSTLIRTKRTSGSSIAPADRICHPFYRSQSIADLAQIGKASLKRMHQLGGMGTSPPTDSHQDDSGDYPTLKLSSSQPQEGKKENVKTEKAAAPSVAIVKPERVKRSPTKASPSPSHEEGGKDSQSRFQKFGVRVLPDPTAAVRTSLLVSEDTKVSEAVEPDPKKSALEPELKQNEHNTIIEKVSEGGSAPSISEVDGTKSKSTSPLYDERGIDIGPVDVHRGRPKSPLAHRTEDTHGESNVKHLLSKGLQNLKEKLHHNDKKKGNPDSAGASEQEDSASPHSSEGQIPTEIPEEVRRAAMAARSNRKPSEAAVREGKRTTSGSSSEGDTDSLGRNPRRTNKRKAPPPPPEDGDDKSQPESEQEMDRLPADDNTHTVESTASPSDVTVPVEITSITIEPTKPNLTTITPNKTGEDLMPQDPDDNSKPKPEHTDYEVGVNVSGIASDSDSDLERLAGDDDSYDDLTKTRKGKKGGTTIELNSSHITIHHSPSSETVQLDNESTRKAASLGDLSRLDTEQPMSILERAVSLDLADGGTPHGSKKRKAPLPPPGEDYFGMADPDDGITHRKEPRLDTAMDTFQRRRLKKSSDWGTLEEALMQTEENKNVEQPSKSEEVTTSITPFTNPLSGISRTDILSVDDAAYSSILGITNSGPSSLDQTEKTVLRITPEPEQSYSTSQVTISSSVPDATLVTSTPISHSISTSHNGNDSLQSPIVTSSHSGVSSVHVVSSTTQDMEPDSSVLTDPFVTAVDSTTSTLAGEMTRDSEDVDDPTWSQDSQPPELPTSPMPVLNQMSTFKPSSSMTYITEIQVVTSADNNSSVPEEQIPDEVTSSVAQRVLQYNLDTSSEAETETPVPPKGNVSVTAIRNTASRIPMRITTISNNTVNHVSNAEERRLKPARPPVPPRKSDSSASAGKFFSFPSSTENGTTRNSTSFEQWVFLDDSSTPNGLETAVTTDDSSATVVSLPSRTPSVTHIVLDSKQSNGKR